MKIGIVVSQWYWEDITRKMLEAAKQEAQKSYVELKVYKAPGSFDIPLFVKKLLEEGVDGVVTLGAIIQGKTAHDEVIGHALSKTLMELSLEYGKPVVLGVNGPKMSKQQAIERIPRAAHVMKACIDMIREIKGTL